MESSPLDDALTVFAATAPRYGSLGLANHGPDGRRGPGPPGPRGRHRGLGRAATGGASSRPRRRPTGRSPRRTGRRPSARRSASPDWLALFEREVADRPPVAVVGEWAPRLLPGTIGAAAPRPDPHRARGARPGRRRHAAAPARAGQRSGLLGLDLPGAARAAAADRATRASPDALADLPYLPEDAPRQLLISDMVAQVGEIADEFEQAVASLGWTAGPVELLDQLASGGALAYLRNADDGGAIGLLHSVTVAPGLRARPALARRRGPGRRPRLRVAGRGRAARRLRHRSQERAGRERDARRPTRWSTGRWPRATSTPSS